MTKLINSCREYTSLFRFVKSKIQKNRTCKITLGHALISPLILLAFRGFISPMFVPMLLSDCGLIPSVLYKPRTRISKGFPVQGAPGFVENHRNPVILHGYGRNTAIPITIGTKRTSQNAQVIFSHAFAYFAPPAPTWIALALALTR